ncbi:hypothetical protein [Rhizobacter sp. P5_C2]
MNLAPAAPGAVGRPLSVTTLIATAAATGLLLILMQPDNLALLLCDLAIVTLLAVNFTAIYTLRTYLFSSGFWTALFFGFYFVLKSTQYFDEAENPWIISALLQCSLFLVFFNAGYLLSSHGQRPQPAPEHFTVKNSRRLALACTVVFIASKVLNYLAVVAILPGGYNQLELSQSTQNQGMAYIFRAFSIGQLALLMLMAFYFIHRRHGAYLLACILIYLLEAASSASRGGLIILILSLFYLYDKHVKRVSPLWLVVIAPVLIFIVSFFGYVRSIEIGSTSVYLDALSYFIDDSEIIWRLFMGRLDLLPTIANALFAHARGELQQLWGSSYVGIFTHFIPRNLWPDKPPLTAAYMTAVVLPGNFEAGVLVYPSMALEGFLNFGYAGIAMSASFAGYLSYRYDRWMISRRLGSTFFYLAFFTFPMGLIAEGIHSNFVALSLYSVALIWLLLKLLHATGALQRASRRPAAVPAAPGVVHVAPAGPSR